jgi:hypothetical protein
MFVCTVKYSSVVNMIYSKQLVLLYYAKSKAIRIENNSVCAFLLCQFPLLKEKRKIVNYEPDYKDSLLLSQKPVVAH